MTVVFYFQICCCWICVCVCIHLFRFHLSVGFITYTLVLLLLSARLDAISLSILNIPISQSFYFHFFRLIPQVLSWLAQFLGISFDVVVSDFKLSWGSSPPHPWSHPNPHAAEALGRESSCVEPQPRWCGRWPGQACRSTAVCAWSPEKATAGLGACGYFWPLFLSRGLGQGARLMLEGCSHLLPEEGRFGPCASTGTWNPAQNSRLPLPLQQGTWNVVILPDWPQVYSLASFGISTTDAGPSLNADLPEVLE